MIAAALFLVVYSLDRPTPPSYPPTPPDPSEVGEALVGPILYTVDAQASEGWTYFDFSTGSVVSDPDPTDWDLAFQRFRIGANGGGGLVGRGGIIDLGPLSFDSLRQAPESGYEPTGKDTLNPAIADWYDYSILSHLVTPRPRVYAVRTADGRHAKIQLMGYYCPDAVSGCVTFRYVYQGDGSQSLEPH